MDLLRSLLVPGQELPGESNDHQTASETSVPETGSNLTSQDPQEAAAPMKATGPAEKQSFNSILDVEPIAISAEQFRAELVAREACAATPLARKIKSQSFIQEAPQWSGSHIRKAATSTSVEPVPINLSQKYPDYISQLNELCQKRGLPAPIFDFEQHGINGAGTFAAKLSLSLPKSWANCITPIKAAEGGGGQPCVSTESSESEGYDILVVEDQGYQSKRDGKKAVAERALTLINQAIEYSTATIKDVEASSTGGSTSVQQEEDYISLLFTLAQATSTQGLSYTYFALGTQFSCTVTIPSVLLPALNCTLQPQTATFGSATLGFRNKKAARAAASKEAVLYLRSHGRLAGPGAPPLTKRKRILSDASSAATTTTTTTTGTNESPHPALSNGRSAPAGFQAATEPPTKETTSGTKLAALRDKLGLSNFTYRLSPHDGSASFYSGAVYFADEVDPRLQGPLGAVSGVYGKKNAKEEIARGACAVLEAVLRERVAGVAGRAHGSVQGGR